MHGLTKLGHTRTIIITLILLWLTTITLTLASKIPPTSDEYTFVPSGYSYWKTGDFRMNTEQPPLIKLFNTIPLLFMDVQLPIEHPSWNKAQLFGENGFYQHFIFEANDDKKELLLFASRAMNVIFAIALGLLILRWATELFGQNAGILALTLYALEPTILAYSSLFMMEIGFSFFSTLALYTLWKFLNNPTKKTWALTAVALGLVQLTKHTAVFLFGIWLLIIITHCWLTHKTIKNPKHGKLLGISNNSWDFLSLEVSNQSRSKLLSMYSLRAVNKTISRIASFAGMIFVAIFLINLTYGFKGSFQTVNEMFENDKTIDKTIYTPEKLYGNTPILKFITENVPLPLPYHYVKGLGYVIVEAKSPRTTYLFGKSSDDGFWHYYLLSGLVKTPVPHLILFITAIGTFLFTKKNFKQDIFLLLPAIIFLILFSTNNKQIGIRHLLHVYPLLIIFTSRIMRHKMLNAKYGTILLCMAGLFAAQELYTAFPDYISYANQIIGLDNAHNYFADSNIDLAQNSDKAINFIKQHPETKVSIYTTDTLPRYTTFKTTTRCETGTLIADAFTLNTNKEFQKLKCTKPAQRLGRTLFVYDVKKC